jgi:hypothetical protein
MITRKLKYFIGQWPIRVHRLVLHFAYPLFRNSIYVNPIRPIGILGWLCNAFLYIFDVLGIPEFLEILFSIFKWKIRFLTDDEIALSRDVFGDNIDYTIVTIDRETRLGTKKWAHAYVTFNTINYQHQLEAAIFIHEMVHVWQYQKFGSLYIYHAIHAQYNGGYDYGGINNLYKLMVKNTKLITFNFEQQAEIIEDMYRLREEGFGNSDSIQSQVYNYYANQLGDLS